MAPAPGDTLIAIAAPKNVSQTSHAMGSVRQRGQAISATKIATLFACVRAMNGSPSAPLPAGTIRGLTRWTSRRTKCRSASPAASTFFTQSVLPWPSAIATTLPLRYAVTMVSYGLPDLRPRCLIVAIPGRKRENGLIIGLTYLTWKFSAQTGNTIGTPGALLG